LIHPQKNGGRNGNGLAIVKTAIGINTGKTSRTGLEILECGGVGLLSSGRKVEGGKDSTCHTGSLQYHREVEISIVDGSNTGISTKSETITEEREAIGKSERSSLSVNEASKVGRNTGRILDTGRGTQKLPIDKNLRRGNIVGGSRNTRELIWASRDDSVTSLTVQGLDDITIKATSPSTGTIVDGVFEDLSSCARKIAESIMIVITTPNTIGP